LIIIDEKLGRYHAMHSKLKVTGTIGVLIKAKKNGIIEEIKPILFELTNKNVWISKKLIFYILEQVNEN
jgi:predicted nucleic acid-binding protein